MVVVDSVFNPEKRVCEGCSDMYAEKGGKGGEVFHLLFLCALVSLPCFSNHNPCLSLVACSDYSTICLTNIPSIRRDQFSETTTPLDNSDELSHAIN